MTACDISEDALEVARRNAEKNGVADRIEFLQSDLFFIEKKKKVTQIKETFDMILSQSALHTDGCDRNAAERDP